MADGGHALMLKEMITMASPQPNGMIPISVDPSKKIKD